MPLKITFFEVVETTIPCNPRTNLLWKLTIAVTAQNTGNMQLFVRNLTHATDLTALAALSNDGEAFVEGELVIHPTIALNDGAIWQERWTFIAAAGRTLTVDLSVPGHRFNPGIRIYKPDGSLLKEDSASGDLDLYLPLPDTGIYTVVVYRRSVEGQGRYELWMGFN